MDDMKSTELVAGRSKLSKKRLLLRLLLVLGAFGALLLIGANFWADHQMKEALTFLDEHNISSSLNDYSVELEEGEVNGSHPLAVVSHLMATVGPNPQHRDWRDMKLAEVLEDPVRYGAVVKGLGRPTYGLVLEVLELHETTHRARTLGDDAVFGTAAAVHEQSSNGLSALALRGVLRAQILVDLNNQDGEMAYRRVATMFQIGIWLQMEAPSLLTWLLGNGMANSALLTLEELLPLSPPTSEDIRRIRKAMDVFTSRSSSFGLEAELATQHSQVQRDLYGALSGGSSLGMAWKRFLGTWVETAFHAHYLKAYGRVIVEARRPVLERADFSDLIYSKNPFDIPVRFLVPNLTGAIDTTDALRARILLARLALDVLESPELASAGLESWPRDPFSGDSLKAKPTPEGRRLIYSVGINQKDDGGEGPGKPGRVGEPDDIAWLLWMPSAGV